MYCPNCNEEFDGKFCPECGSKLIEKDTATNNCVNLNLGDGNAISGGISVTHNNTIVERNKSADEIIAENENKYMNQCKRSLTDLVITNEEAAELESLRLELSISPDRANELLEQVRQLAMKSNVQSQLTGVAKIKAKQFYDAIAKNNPSLIKMMLPAIEAYVASNQNEELQFNYYMVLAALEPISCINAYEKRKADNYWMSFWTYLSYVKDNRLQDSEMLLAEIDIKFPELPSENTAILASAGILITQGPEVASDYLESIEGDYSPILQHFLDAITSAVDNNAKIYNGSQFYSDNLLPSCNLSEIAKRQAKIEMQMKIEEARKIASRDSRFEYNEDCSILKRCVDDFEDSNGHFELPLCVKQIGYQLGYKDGQTLYRQGFSGVTGLGHIKLHNNLEIIGIAAFLKTKIEKLDIPDSIKEIHALAFSRMPNLKSINLPKCKIDTHGLFWNSSIEHVEIPEGVTSLKSYMFSKTPDLDSVILPNTIINIEKYAFDESAIRTIDIPEGTKEIQTNAFYSCYNLKTVSLPSSLFKIESCAFRKCKMIQHVYLHGVPRVVGALPFASCSKFKLHVVDIEPSNELELFLNEINRDVEVIYVKSEEVDRFKSAIPKYSSLIYAEPKKPETEDEMRIEESRTQAEKDMRIIYNGDCSELISTNTDFKDSSFELPLCVKQISTFEDNRISGSRIRNRGFADCQELKTIKLHDNLDKIGIGAFKNTNIEDIEIPDSVQEIGKYAFAYTKNLKHITLPAQCKVDTLGLFLESAIESIRIPEGTTTIDQDAFRETYALRHVDIPSTVTSINLYAFFRSGIRSITLPEGLKTIDSCAFAEAADLEIANLPSTLTEINTNAFSDSGIKEATIPDGVKILDGAYLRCKNLTTISLPESLIELDDFWHCVNLNDVYLRAVPKIYKKTNFRGCSFNLHLGNLAPSDELLSFINTFGRNIKKIYVGKADLNQFTSAFPSLSSLIEAEQDETGKTEECSIVADSTPEVIETAEIVKPEATTEEPIVADSTPEVIETAEIVKLEATTEEPIVADSTPEVIETAEIVKPEATTEVSFVNLQNKAENGDLEAQYMLAECYWNGTGVKQSLKTAVSLYKKAADAGYMLAQYKYGLIKEEGLAGVNKCSYTAATWYKRAEAQGHVDSMIRLGNMYKEGRGRDQNYEIARRHYLKAIKHGSKEAKRIYEEFLSHTHVELWSVKAGLTNNTSNQEYTVSIDVNSTFTHAEGKTYNLLVQVSGVDTPNQLIATRNENFTISENITTEEAFAFSIPCSILNKNNAKGDMTFLIKAKIFEVSGKKETEVASNECKFKLTCSKSLFGKISYK